MPGIIDASNIIYRPVKVTFLEMHDRKGEPAMLQGTRFDLLPKPIDAGLYRKYYYRVGEKYMLLCRSKVFSMNRCLHFPALVLRALPAPSENLPQVDVRFRRWDKPGNHCF